MTVDAIVDERTRFEMYYPPFAAAVEAGVGSVMCSYNKVNGAWSCENPSTLGTDLKHRLGFGGWVMSDWGATHSASIGAGLDQEMPAGFFMGKPLAAAVANGTVSRAQVDDSALRILTPMFAMGLFDVINNHSSGANVTSQAHNDLARDLAANSTVLLTNRNRLLPLDPTRAGAYGTAGEKKTETTSNSLFWVFSSV